MAISIHNYTILDHLADYLLRIREAVQGDGSYQYVCVMERRCFNLVARFSPELLDRVVTSNGLLCMGTLSVISAFLATFFTEHVFQAAIRGKL